MSEGEVSKGYKNANSYYYYEATASDISDILAR